VNTYVFAGVAIANILSVSPPMRQPGNICVVCFIIFPRPCLRCCPLPCVQFAVLEIVWLAELLRQQQQHPAAGSSGGSSGSSVFSSIPESVLSDAASWLTFVIQMREAEQLAAIDIGERLLFTVVIVIVIVILIVSQRWNQAGVLSVAASWSTFGFK
jgi:preprotein translocase subunit SecG